jgi:hypothetical protein
LASTLRLVWAVAPTTFEPGLVLTALRGTALKGDSTEARRRFSTAIGATGCAWERDLFAAFEARDPAARDALVHEQLTEFDWRTQRWARVPRVCASIATSAGFLFASIGLLQGLASPTVDETPVAAQAVQGTMVSAVNCLAIGIAGTSFCAAVHLRARGVLRDRMVAMDRLVEELRSTAAGVSGVEQVLR